jgi:hypothetical protein
MAISKISGNQISQTTIAIITTLKFLNTNSILKLPVGTTAQRPAGVDVGTIRFNSTNDSAEIYKADDGTGSAGWANVAGGGPALGENSVVRTNQTTISENITIGTTAGSEFANGMSSGPITIANGYTITIESTGSWSVV